MWQLGRSHVTAMGTTLTVPAGSAYSGKFDYRGYGYLGMVVPMQLDGTSFCFQVSADGVAFDEKAFRYALDFAQWQPNQSAPDVLGVYRNVDPEAELRPWPYFRLYVFSWALDQNGAAIATPAPQSADRVFQIVAKT